MFISEIIKKLTQNKNENEISVKIHPTHENLSEYRKIIDPINPKIQIFQKEDLKKLINDTDLIITPVSSTAVISGLIMRKCIIIWNIYDVQNDVLLENDLALECRNSTELLDLVHRAKKWEFPEEKIHKFTLKYLFKSDGKSSERIANAIVQIIKK